MSQSKPTVNPPLWLLAELTYRCPLQCPYCSNPLDFARQDKELTTEQWIEVFRQARAMGSVQLGFSGGEPLTRKDLPELIRAARDLGFYTNLITSGIGLTESKLDAFSEAGLDHIQISFQASDECSTPRWPATKSLPAEADHGQSRESARLPDGAQLRSPPAQHRPAR